jgi:hypothetical protein
VDQRNAPNEENDMRLLAIMVVPPLLWFGFIVFMLLVPLPAPLPHALSSERNKIGAALTLVAGLGYLVLVLGYVMWQYGAAGRAMDPYLAPLGLTGKPYLVLGRAYSGQVAARAMTAEYVPTVSLQRAMFNAYAPVSGSRRLSAGWTTPLAGCAGCPRVQLAGGALSSLVILSDDPAGAAVFLSQEPVAGLILRLLDDPDGLGNRFVHLESGRVWLQARPTPAGLASLPDWLRALADLAELADTPASPR